MVNALKALYTTFLIHTSNFFYALHKCFLSNIDMPMDVSESNLGLISFPGILGKISKAEGD